MPLLACIACVVFVVYFDTACIVFVAGNVAAAALPWNHTGGSQQKLKEEHEHRPRIFVLQLPLRDAVVICMTTAALFGSSLTGNRKSRSSSLETSDLTRCWKRFEQLQVGLSFLVIPAPFATLAGACSGLATVVEAVFSSDLIEVLSFVLDRRAFGAAPLRLGFSLIERLGDIVVLLGKSTEAVHSHLRSICGQGWELWHFSGS